MDLLALEQEIKNLEKQSDALGLWLEFWTFLVVAGLIIEYAPQIWHLVKAFKDKRSFLVREMCETRVVDGRPSSK